MTDTKLNGVYYTPDRLAEWIVQYVASRRKFTNVLEPSCGDGIFIKKLLKYTYNICNIDAVEINVSTCNNIVKDSIVKIINTDFLFFQNTKTYNLIIGNPPYISKKLLTPEQIIRCKSIHSEANLADKEISNIWSSFIVKCEQMLADDGLLAFVLPTEFIQVKFAQEIRDYLCNKFTRLEIITFRQLTFEDIEQDTLVIIAYKKTRKPKGVYLFETDNVNQLFNKKPEFIELPKEHTGKKWSVGVLDNKEICLIDDLTSKMSKIKDYSTSSAGIVTAANKFFIVNRSVVEEYSLQQYTLPMLQRGGFAKQELIFTTEDFVNLVESNKPCFLLDFNGFVELGVDAYKYIFLGEEQKYNERFKMLQRNRWFDVPGISKGEAFFFKRCHRVPKFVLNEADVYVTDSAYKVKANDGVCIESLILSFYNSLTLLCAELFGRYYGGGVLEVTPNEFRELPIPYVNKDEIDDYYTSVSDVNNMEDLINLNDASLLRNMYGIPESELQLIRTAYLKVKKRRIKRDS